MPRPPVSQAYAPREYAIGPSARHEGWRIKRYYVRDRADRFHKDSFVSAEKLSAEDLPQPARTAGRAGAAFTIAHQGSSMSYFVLGWWDNENELPLRVWVTERNRPENWRRAQGGEGPCVWDLDIVWFERTAYVTHVMSNPEQADVAGYLRAAHSRAVPLRKMLKNGNAGKVKVHRS